MPIDSIVVEEERRIRREVGDVERLEASIRALGLLSPIVVTADRRLVAGYRRLTACRKLGWKEIEVTVLPYGNDPLRLLEVEADENLARKDFTPEEIAAIEVRRQEILAAMRGTRWVRFKRWLSALWARVKAMFSRRPAAPAAGH